MTRAIVEIAKPLGIALHDHIIVGRNGDANLEPSGKKSKTSSTAC
jgi:DNA repair protein RadC